MIRRHSYLWRRSVLRGEAILAGTAAILALQRAARGQCPIETAVASARAAFRAAVAVRGFLDGMPWQIEPRERREVA